MDDLLQVKFLVDLRELLLEEPALLGRPASVERVGKIIFLFNPLCIFHVFHKRLLSDIT